jgi:hypothetical protein
MRITAVSPVAWVLNQRRRSIVAASAAIAGDGGIGGEPAIGNG